MKAPKAPLGAALPPPSIGVWMMPPIWRWGSGCAHPSPAPGAPWHPSAAATASPAAAAGVEGLLKAGGPGLRERGCLEEAAAGALPPALLQRAGDSRLSCVLSSAAGLKHMAVQKP